MASGWHAWAQAGGELSGPGTGSTCEKCTEVFVHADMSLEFTMRSTSSTSHSRVGDAQVNQEPQGTVQRH